MCSAPSYLDILNQLLGGGVDRGLGVGHVLDGTGPPGGLVEQFGVEPITVLAAIHSDVPVACEGSGCTLMLTSGTRVLETALSDGSLFSTFR